MKSRLFNAAFVIAVAGLAACSSGPPQTVAAKADAESAARQAPAGPPEPVSAKTAFYKMYMPAHAWAADIRPISLKSGDVAGVKNGEGKAGLWTAIFVSPSQRAARTYVYSVADQPPNIVKGVKANLPEPWGGSTAAVMTFQSTDFATDSDAAYKTAAAKAADWLKTKDNASKPVSLSLGATSRFAAPAVWVVLFGNSKAGYFAVVDASTGNLITK